MFLSVTQVFWIFIVGIQFFLLCNPGSFEITEWEPCIWLLNTHIFAVNAARQWHCW